ncbi:hypothetical protein RDI58_021910 [Solanum bulbocastanum]|uniref:MULE transposase domain-containing protein n=1 Tax=Solanum bulbocastanum TaxID=147425 RepID=A0AAN8Y5L3_SOLBU
MGACKGELLVVVGKNENNQMYLIAWEVVDTETKHSLSWFIRYLIVDLNLGTSEGLTVISDMKKGLVPVLLKLLLNAEKRICARHIWSNWHVRWKGEERRKRLRGGALLNLIVREIQVNKIILNRLEHNQVNKVLFVVIPLLCQELLKQDLQCEVHHTLILEPHMQLHNQVNQALFVLTQHMCRDLLKKRFQLGLEEDWEEKKLMQEGPYLLLKENSSSQLLPLSGHKRPYSSASFAATRGNRRPATGFGVYFDPTTGAQVFNSGISSEKILHGPTKLKSASPTNIYIDFKPHGLN